jgi:hypothetical protein
MTFLELTDCSFGSIHPRQMWLCLLDMSANFTILSAKVPVDLLPGAIHYHNVWYAITLVEQQKRLMRLQLCAHWESTSPSLGSTKDLCVLVLATRLGLRNQRVGETLDR